MATYFVDGAKTTTLKFTGNQTISIHAILTGSTSGSKLFVTGGITNEDEVTGWANGMFFNGEDVVDSISTGTYTLAGTMMGAEKVTNGDFDLGDQDWTKGAGWTIADSGGEDYVGRATATSFGYYLEQNITGLTIGRKYKVIYTIQNYADGTLYIYFDWIPKATHNADITDATFDLIATATSFDLKFMVGNPGTLDINDVSIQEYTVHNDSDNSDGSTWEEAYEGPYGFQEILDDVGLVYYHNIYVRNTFDMEAYGVAIDLDACAGSASGGHDRALDIIGVDSTGTGTNTGNRLPVGSYVKFDGGGTLADSIWHMSGLCQHIRIHNIELTGTDSLSEVVDGVEISHAALNGDTWTAGTAGNYGFIFINCKFADAMRCVDIQYGAGKYARGMSFLFCEFEGNAALSGYLMWMKVISDIHYKNCKFTNPNGTVSTYFIYSPACGVFCDGCIIDGGDGVGNFVSLGGYVSVFSNNLFTRCTESFIYASSVNTQLIEYNNICEVGDTAGADRPFYMTAGIAFSSYSVSNSDSASIPTLVDIQTYLGDKLSMKESNTAFTIGFNDSYELCAPSAILEGGMPDIYGRPTMRGPAQVDPRQKQGILE